MQKKVSKQEARYQEVSVNGDKMCATCTMFIKPDSCNTVEGSISPKGYCRFYERKDLLKDRLAKKK